MADEMEYVGEFAAATDASMAFHVRTDGTATQTEVDKRIAPVTAAIIANDPAVKAALVEHAQSELDAVIDGYFEPTSAAGMVTFPNGSEPGKTVGMRYAIDPTTFPPDTASFHGLAAGTGPGAAAANISVRSPNGTGGQWGNSLSPGFQRPTAGTAIVMPLVDVGTGDGVSRVRIGGLATEGVQSSMGGVIAALFATNNIRFFRWIITSSGFYGLSRWEGTSLSSGAFTTLATTNVAPKVNDLVDLEYTRADGILSLTVNGALVTFVQVSSAVKAAHATANLAGMWANGTLQSGAKLGGWQWVAEYDSPTGTVARQLPTIGVDFTLPASVKLHPNQKRQVLGPVFDIRDYGAKCDGIYLTDVNTYAGQAYVQSPTYTFTSADVGKKVAVMGAGPVIANANDGVWIGTILSLSGNSAVLDSNATTTATGLRCIFGTPDDEALFRAQEAAVAASAPAFGKAGKVYIPDGRTIATLPLRVKDYVDWFGCARDLSWVHVIQDSAGSAIAAGESDWLTCAGRSASNPLIGSHFYDFGIQAEAHVHSAGYGSAVKPFNIYYVQRCSSERMNVWNTPATAIPFDHSYDQCTIRDNFILNPGRLAPSGVGPGGSGIGAGTKANGATEPTLIANNVIIGSHSATAAGPGHNGIFTEAQTGANPDAGVPGYRIVNNVVIGMPYGISDTGSTGTIITGNEVIGCGVGIAMRKTTLPDAYPGLNPIVNGNVVRGSTGPGATDGVGVLVHTVPGTNVKDYIHATITDNQIIDNKSWGVVVNGQGVPVTGVKIRGNQILRNGRSGVKLDTFGAYAGRINYLDLSGNTIAGNGRAQITGDQAAVLIVSGSKLRGGRIQDNDMFDMASTPTQVDRIVQTGAELVDVRVSGNTGDA